MDSGDQETDPHLAVETHLEMAMAKLHLKDFTYLKNPIGITVSQFQLQGTEHTHGSAIPSPPWACCFLPQRVGTSLTTRALVLCFPHVVRSKIAKKEKRDLWDLMLLSFYSLKALEEQ